MNVNAIIDQVIARERGYVNDPLDRGGETNYGITWTVARANGYHGPMKDMPRSVAVDIYTRRYILAPCFDKVLLIDQTIGEELIDTGVNMGPHIAAEFLQRALNALNDNATHYQDLFVDGRIGVQTYKALGSFLAWRGQPGRNVLLTLLNSLQAIRYLDICEHAHAQERFLFGWIAQRVHLPTTNT